MIANWSPSQRLGYGLLVVFALSVVGYIGGQGLKRPAPIVYEQAQLISREAASNLETSPSESAPVAAEPAVQEVVVHVAGAVNKPGIARLPLGARVQDALEAAGGPLQDADLNSINLAGKVTDGVQIYVSKQKESIPEAINNMPEELRGGEAAAKPAAATPSAPAPAKKSEPGIVRLNVATQAELESLPGIGPVTARSILEYRKAHGGFSSIDELQAVKGIGPKKLEAVRKYVRL